MNGGGSMMGDCSKINEVNESGDEENQEQQEKLDQNLKDSLEKVEEL